MKLPLEKALIALLLAATALLLGLGAVLAADPAFSLSSLGYPDCLMLRAIGKPCPFCGGTAAFLSAMRGDLAAAWSANPFALLVVVTLVAASAFLAVALMWPRSIRPVLRSRVFIISTVAWGAILLFTLVFHWLAGLL